jgi:hypothetical protein
MGGISLSLSLSLYIYIYIYIYIQTGRKCSFCDNKICAVQDLLSNTDLSCINLVYCMFATTLVGP